MKKQVIFILEEDLLKKFKSYCALNSITMTDQIRKLMEQTIEQTNQTQK